MKHSTVTTTKNFYHFASGELAFLTKAFLMTGILLLLNTKVVFAWSEAEFEYMKQSTSEPHVNVGMAALGCKAYKDAIKEFDAAIKNNPNNGFAYSGRSDAFIGLGQYSEALSDIENALRIRPQNYEFLSSRAHIFRHLQKYAEAISDYNKILELEPNCKFALLYRANTFLSWKKYKEALSDFDQYLLDVPDDADACVGRAMTYMRLAKVDLVFAEKLCVNNTQLPLKRRLKHLIKQIDKFTKRSIPL